MKINIHESVKDLLARHKGKHIIIRLNSGQDLEGELEEIGDHVLHMTELAGMEFYDAVVRLETVAALIVRTRSE
jgi:hypothetical protein